jgi:phage shock protein A
MGSFDRLREALRANLNDLLDKAGDRDGSAFRRLTEELEETVKVLHGELREARARLTEVERDLHRAQAAASADEQRAMAALREGDEAQARAHLASKLRHEAEAKDLDATLASERAALSELQEGVAVLEEKLGTARGRLSSGEAPAVEDELRHLKDKLDKK